MSTKVWRLIDRYDEMRQRAGVPPVLQAAEYGRAEKGKKPGVTTFVMSTGGVKRDGFEIVQSGWQVDAFLEKNPLAPWRHSTASVRDAMGIWTDVWKSNKGGSALHLRGDLTWNGPEHNPDAPYVQQMYDDGRLRACSVRWEEADAKAIEEITAKELEGENVDWYAKMYGGIRFLRSLLIECSPCMLGLDKDALKALPGRVRSGELPESVLDRFIVRVGEDHPKIEGREVLLLDGHPLTFEVERPTTVDLGARAEEASAEARAQCPHCGATNAKDKEKCSACGKGMKNEKTEQHTDDPEPTAEQIAADAIAAARQQADELDRAERTKIAYSVHGKTPLSEGAWDGGAARKALRSWADGDMSKYKQGFAARDGDAANFTSYKFPHHTIADGKLVTKRRGVYVAAQRIQQGKSPVGGDAKPHIGAHYEQDLNETPPWKTAKGRAYELLHEQLRTAGEGEDVTAIRAAIVAVGTELFGEHRQREDWEPRATGDQASVWAAVSDILSAGVDGGVVDDEDERAARIDSMLDALQPVLAPLLQASDTVHAHARSLELIATDLGLSTATVEAIREAIGALRAPAAVTAEIAAPSAVDLSAVAERIGKIKTGKKATTLLERAAGEVAT